MAKKRSAIIPTKNGEMIAASAVALYAQTDLLAGELPSSEVGAHGDVPRPPDEVLEEHHHGELDARR